MLQLGQKIEIRHDTSYCLPELQGELGVVIGTTPNEYGDCPIYIVDLDNAGHEHCMAFELMIAPSSHDPALVQACNSCPARTSEKCANCHLPSSS